MKFCTKNGNRRKKRSVSVLNLHRRYAGLQIDGDELIVFQVLQG